MCYPLIFLILTRLIYSTIQSYPLVLQCFYWFKAFRSLLIILSTFLFPLWSRIGKIYLDESFLANVLEFVSRKNCPRVCSYSFRDSIHYFFVFMCSETVLRSLEKFRRLDFLLPVFFRIPLDFLRT